MEDLLGFAVMIVVCPLLILIRSGAYALHGLFVGRGQKRVDFSVRDMKLVCPSCLNELNNGHHSAAIRECYEMGHIELTLKCRHCSTVSVWSFLTTPPKLN